MKGIANFHSNIIRKGLYDTESIGGALNKWHKRHRDQLGGTKKTEHVVFEHYLEITDRGNITYLTSDSMEIGGETGSFVYRAELASDGSLMHIATANKTAEGPYQAIVEKSALEGGNWANEIYRIAINGEKSENFSVRIVDRNYVINKLKDI